VIARIIEALRVDDAEIEATPARRCSALQWPLHRRRTIGYRSQDRKPDGGWGHFRRPLWGQCKRPRRAREHERNPGGQNHHLDANEKLAAVNYPERLVDAVLRALAAAT